MLRTVAAGADAATATHDFRHQGLGRAAYLALSKAKFRLLGAEATLARVAFERIA